jgi:hypothetical protein
MREYLTIGSAPCDEECASLGTHGYAARARAECEAYIEAIRTKLGPEPKGAQLAVKPFPHDSGSYYEVICRYDDAYPGSVDYAFRCESDAPETWAEVGMQAPAVPPRRAHGR